MSSISNSSNKSKDSRFNQLTKTLRIQHNENLDNTLT
jgi:hypothetical protein